MGKALHQPDTRGGRYSSGVPHCVLDHDAYRTASLRAKAILHAILRDFTGFNNGTIAVPRAEIAERIGCHNHTANRAAVGELVARGLVKARVFPRGSRKATEFELTWISTGDKGERPASNEYAAWQPGDAGTGKKRRAIVAQRNRFSGAVIAHDGKPSCATIAPHEAINGASSCAIVAQHIDYQGKGEPGEPSDDGERSGRPERDANERPQSVTHERWIAAGKRAAATPAAPPPAELRDKVAEHVRAFGRGSQGRLASAAGILEGTFSKFRKGDLDLPGRMRVALACALPRAAAAEAKRQPKAAARRAAA